MSGERLREAAIMGDAKLSQKYLGDSCNVCSADKYGITALHYAVWNGHLDCVKFLASNPWGVDAAGHRTVCLDLVTCKGYTALHLAALDCPRDVRAAVVQALLVCGCDPDIRDNVGRTAMEYAEENDDRVVRDAFLSLDAELIAAVQGDLAEHYTFGSRRRWDVEEGSLAKAADFTLPPYIYEEQVRRPYLPRSLAIHEHHILPLIRTADAQKDVQALHCLTFARQQAASNRQRREAILRAGDQTWEPAAEGLLTSNPAI